MKPAFMADRTLGKLVKWLRLMGFDTIIESDSIDRVFQQSGELNRLVLTRTEHVWQRIPERNAIWIEANDPTQQIRQVISQLNIKYAALEPFTRCLSCNEPLKSVPRRQALGLVPDYIWDTQSQFNQCPGCRRIFWPGSHIRRSRERLEQFFNG